MKMLITLHDIASVLIAYLTFSQIACAQDYIKTETCFLEEFEASCKEDDQVLVIEGAEYGMMRLDRCVTTNYESAMGCRADVRIIVDAKCSGRKHCRFHVADPDVGITKVKPCPKEFAPYLEVTHSCRRVETCNMQECEQSSSLRLTSQRGLISNSQTLDFKCGSMFCPWVIQVLPGQRINVTLLDFSLTQRNSTPHNKRHKQQSYGSSSCYNYAMVKEAAVPRTAKICGDDVREKLVYTSSSNEIEITIETRLKTRNQDHFILRYAAVGCPDMAPTANSIIRRNGPILTIRCNQSKETWKMQCVQNDWVGEMKNCSFDQSWRISEGLAGIGLPSAGVSVLIIFGVALVVVLYIAISIVCVLYFRRHRRRAQQRSSQSTHESLCDDMIRHPANYEERTPMLIKPQNNIYRKIDASDYADACELQFLDTSTGLLAADMSKGHHHHANLLKTTCPTSGMTHALNRDTRDFCNANTPSAAPPLHTFKPQHSHNHLYDYSPHQKNKEVPERTNPVVLPRYHELDVSRLHTCHSLSGSGDKLDSACMPDLHRDVLTHDSNHHEGAQNDENNLKETT